MAAVLAADELPPLPNNVFKSAIAELKVLTSTLPSNAVSGAFVDKPVLASVTVEFNVLKSLCDTFPFTVVVKVSTEDCGAFVDKPVLASVTVAFNVSKSLCATFPFTAVVNVLTED